MVQKQEIQSFTQSKRGREYKGFWRRLQRQENGCITWPGGHNGVGHGRYKDPATGKLIYPHRKVWEDLVEPIPPGYEIHHACKNRACVNTHHLEMLPAEEHRRIVERDELCKNGHPRNLWTIRRRGRLVCKRCDVEKTLRWQAKQRVRVDGI